MVKEDHKNRLLVIGLDGASYYLVRDWVKKGELKTLGKLMKNGSEGILKSTIPPVTFPAIPSFMTGKNPGKHGVASFFRPKTDRKMGLVNSNSIENEFWNLEHMKKKNKLIINLPLTYPAKPLNGWLITGALTPSKDDEKFIYPPEFREEIKELLSSYIIDVDMTFIPSKRKEYMAACIDTINERMKFVSSMMQKVNWDICIVYCTLLDRLQHHLFGLDDNTWILEGYKLADKCVGKMLSLAGEDTNFIIFSDHGFGLSEGRFYVNAWLTKNGYLRYKKENPKPSLASKLKSSQFNTIMNRITNIIPGSILQKGLNILDRMGKTHSFDAIDWTKTKLYATINGIYVNTVDPKERERLINDTILKLKQLRNPVTNEKLDIKVYRREELYSGEQITNLPDIVFKLEDYSFEPFAQFEIMEPLQSFTNQSKGWHREEGLIIAYGPTIAKGKVEKANIVDLAPTILHMFGSPIPDDMDGKVLMKIFNRDSEIFTRQPKYVTSVYKDSDGLIKDKAKLKIRDKITELQRKGKI